MKGRMYDPFAGRFLSADPILQAPTWSQGLNAFSYVWNNPTNLTDPSGFMSFNDVMHYAVAGFVVVGHIVTVGAIAWEFGGLSTLGRMFGGIGVEEGLGAGQAAARALQNASGGPSVSGPSSPSGGGLYNDVAAPAGLLDGADQRLAAVPAPQVCDSQGRPGGCLDCSKQWWHWACSPGLDPPMAGGVTKVGHAAFRGALALLRWVAAKMGPRVAARGGAKAAERLTVTFGRNANQIQHAFRHTDKLGLSRTAVQEAVERHLPSVVDKIPAGRPLNEVIEVGGQRIQYSAFRLPDGSIDVGRIHGVP